MSRQRAFYYPLVLVVFFGLAISLMPASPALGSNLPLGVTVQQLNFSPNSLVRYSHTFQIGSGGTPTQNGVALLGARDVISNSQPSAANPYLIKLEPGNYDLGNQSLALLPFVDLEGSGEGTTVIASTVGQTDIHLTKATLIAASNSEVRLLKTTNFGANTVQGAILVPASATNARFSHVTAAVSGSSGTNIGFYSDGANITVADTTLTTFGGNRNSGLYHNSGIITITNSTLSATDGLVNNAAILDNGDEFQRLTVNNSNLTASGKSLAAAMATNAAIVNINNSSFTASTQGSNQGIAYGMLINDGGAIVSVTDSELDATGVAQGYGIFNTGDVHVRNSSLTGRGTTSYGMSNANPNSGIIANTMLSGFTAASNNLAFCPASVNGRTLALLNAGCK